MSLRKIILYVVILAILIGSAPYFTGYLAQIKFQDMVTIFSDIETLPVNIDILEYHRGWRASYAKTRVTLFARTTLEKPNNFSFILEHDIRHGPFVQLHNDNYKDWRFARAVIYSQLYLTDKAKEILKTELGDTELLNLNSQINIDGAVDIDIQGKALQLKEHAGTNRSAWQGMKGHWHLNFDMKNLTGEMLFPGFDFDLNGIHYDARNIIYEVDLIRTPDNLWPGKVVMNVESFNTSQGPTNTPLNITGLTANVVATTHDTMFDFAGLVHVATIFSHQKQYGPMDYMYSLKNIDAHAIVSYFDLRQKMRLASPSEQINYYRSMFALIPEILKYQPEFSVDKFQIHTEAGDIQGKVHMVMGGNDVQQPQQIVQSIVANMQLILPKSTFRDLLQYQYSQQPLLPNQTAQDQTQQINQRINDSITHWLQDNTLIEKDQNYIINANFQDGKFTVNGQAQALPQVPWSGAGAGH